MKINVVLPRKDRVELAILGATNMLGKKIIDLLATHPLFKVTQLYSNEDDTGKKYGQVIRWIENRPMADQSIGDLELRALDKITAPIAISLLPDHKAEKIEKQLIEKGIHVISGASVHRMSKDVPLIIPEINPDHLEMVKNQKTKGKIITGPNGAATFLALGLNPLRKIANIDFISIVTLQAVSSAGNPGVQAMDIIGNTIPNIPGEEEKIEREIKKIFGTPEKLADFGVICHVNRVPISHGHSVVAHVFFDKSVPLQAAEKRFVVQKEDHMKLYEFHSDPLRPQPLTDISLNDNRTHIGRLKQGPEDNILGLVSMGHNLVKGAVGNLIQILELFYKTYCDAYPALKSSENSDTDQSNIFS